MKRKKMVSVKVVFDRKHVSTKSHAKERRTGPIAIEVYYDTRRVYLQTGVKVYSDQFKNGRVYNHAQQVALNERIRMTIDEAESYINGILKSGKSFDMDAFKTYISVSRRDGNGDTFLNFVEDQIEAQDNRESTKAKHRQILRFLRKWGHIRTFEDLTVENIAAWHQEAVSASKIGSYSINRDRVLRKYTRLAYRMNLISADPYDKWVAPPYSPVDTYRYISLTELDKIRKLTLEKPKENAARDLFLFQANTGLAYIDTQAFDHNRIINTGSMMAYDGMRVKTSRPFYVPLTKEAVEILDRYGGAPPKLTDSAYRHILYKIGRMAGLSERLSSHKARHTFAVMCINKGMPIEILSKILGHTNIKTTQIYGKILKSSIDTAFKKIMGDL